MAHVSGQRSRIVHLAVVLVTAVAFVSIATGLAAMSTDPTFETGFHTPTLATATGFSGVLVGFALLGASWGMRRGFRVAYLAAIVLVVLAATHGIVQTRLLSIPLVVLSLVVTALLVRWRSETPFTRSITLTESQIGAVLAVGSVVCYGTIGSYVLRADFEGVDSLIDGLYFTLVTASTVGYGDIHASTDAGRLFAISLVLLGPASVAAIAGSLIGPSLQSYFTRAGARATNAERPTNGEQFLLIGTSTPGNQLISSLSRQGALTVVTTDEGWATQLEADDIDVTVGDPTDDKVLEQATPTDLTAIVVATDAEETPYTVLAARRLDSTVRLIALVARERRADIAELGADVTIDPAHVLERATTAAALGGEFDAVAERGGDS
ncbi:potassium transporter TrkA [Natronolimnobius sp. AArcel1]|uniref:NAD-binding protein n=1 Tax=Natronolimnobius sp. AArcel1 TaxID=1679093 RepID=UPI0013EA29F2|nr:NAD-binding protein [Natronolimnobius sp. AArcel1]NGM67603.1 potassium transporter TrkA [Natronolimnobius sp. AArcel1]